MDLETLNLRKNTEQVLINDLLARQKHHEDNHGSYLVTGSCAFCTDLLIKVEQAQNRVKSIEGILNQQ